MSEIELYTPEMAGSGQYGACCKCGLLPTKEGYDGCIGELKDPDVMNACCGHGDDTGAYVQFFSDPDNAIRGDGAVDYIKKQLIQGVSYEYWKIP